MRSETPQRGEAISQIRRFAWFVLGLNTVTILCVCVLPWLVAIGDRARLGSFLTPDQMGELARLRTQQLFPLLFVTSLFAAAGIACGVGLLKLRGWGRHGWVLVTTVWLAWIACQVRRDSWTWVGLLGPLFRLVVTVVSIWFLMRRNVREAFELELRSHPEDELR